MPWELLTELFKAHGLMALIQVAEAVLIVYLIKQAKAKDDLLHKIADKRLADVKESKEDYEDLLRDVNRSLDMMIRVLSKD